MSYPRDLDDYCESELTDELKRRATLRKAGKCDYCERAYGTEPSCMHNLRHRGVIG